MKSTLITPEEYFNSKELVIKKRYDALSDFFKNKKSAEEVAEKFGQPQLLEFLKKSNEIRYPWLDEKNVHFNAIASS